MDRLPDGRVLVTRGHAECWSTSADPSSMVAIDPATGSADWSMTFADPQLAIYRSEWVDGCRWFGNVGACPALAGRWDALSADLGGP